jgi:hypothetical protein
MKTLNPDWFYQDLQDFEYKKYILLAYLQDVHKQFNETKLYPGLGDLVFHYRNLTSFLELKKAFRETIPDYLQSINLSQFKIAMNNALNDDKLMKYIEDLLDFSIPEIRKYLDEGKEIYEFIENEIMLTPVGILPIYKDEGYLFIKAKNRTIDVHEYSVKLFSQEDTQYRSIHTNFVTSYTHNLVNSFENIKIDMIKKYRKLPNPAVFGIETPHEYPLHETIIPIAKRMLIKYVG